MAAIKHIAVGRAMLISREGRAAIQSGSPPRAAPPPPSLPRSVSLGVAAYAVGGGWMSVVNHEGRGGREGDAGAWDGGCECG